MRFVFLKNVNLKLVGCEATLKLWIFQVRMVKVGCLRKFRVPGPILMSMIN